MIEDKIKQEYEWQHSEIGQPTLDELFSKINEALGIELWIWQKTYMTMGIYRQMGATTAQCLRVLLFSETTPLDYSSPPRTAREDCERQQWKKNYKKQYGYNPPAYMDKRKRRKARAQQPLPCAGISVEQITQAMATFTEAVFTAAGNICNALAQAFSRQAQAFNAVADQYKDDKAGAIHGE